MARVITKTGSLSREEWLKYRRRGIGGSDAAVICGLSPWRSLTELWADKTGRLKEEKEDNESMRQGRDLETYVARRFTESTGKRVHRRNAMFQHKDVDFLLANVDREIYGENAGLECKTTTQFNKSDFENGEIPLYYLCQCRHYMNVMDYDRMYLAVLVFGSGFYWYAIDRDREEENALQRLEVDFWNKWVVPDVCPPADGKEATTRALTSCAGELGGEAAMFDEEPAAERYVEINRQIDELKGEQELIKQQLIMAMDGHAKGYTQSYKVSFASSERTSIDSKLLKRQYPDIYREVSKTTSVRTFRLAERK